MSTPPAPLLQICHFESPYLTVQPYFCFNHEICCKEGCCSPYEHRYFQSWHFWYKIYIVLGLVLLFLLYRYCYWYCKKIRTPPSGRTRNEETANSHLVNLMVSYDRRDSTGPKDDEPPPRYSVALTLPKPSDQVPTYEQATALNQ